MPNVMKEDDERDQEELIIVEEENKQQASADQDNDDDHEDGDHDDKEDAKSAKADEDDDTEDEREAIRERRRKEKQERKERREKAISRDKLELDFLRKRNDDLERRLSAQEQRSYQSDLNSIDSQIQQAQKEAEMADRVIAKAIEAGNGSDAAQALKYRDEAIAKIHQLNSAKQSAQNRPAQSQGIDDLTMHYAQQFINRNKWYDPTGGDEDSAIVLAIDQTLVKEGYDPRTEDYWDELESRAARRLPDHFNTNRRARTEPREERTPRGGPAVGSGKEHAPNSTRKEIYISPERKQALIDAGVWDDPELRMKYVKRYAEYDRQKR